MRRDLRSHYASTEDSYFAHHEFTIIQCCLQSIRFFSPRKKPLCEHRGILACLPITFKVSHYRPLGENSFSNIISLSFFSGNPGAANDLQES
jgi:hypothetical protein